MRQPSRSSLVDASHVAVAGSRELSSHGGAAGDTYDADDQASPFTAAGGGIVQLCVWYHSVICIGWY